MSHYINGEWIEGQGRAFTSTQPATGERLWQGYCAEPSEMEAAVQAAHAAQPSWSQLDLFARVHFLKTFKNILTERAEEMAVAIANEVGKPLWDARTEVQTMLSKIDISVQAYHERTGDKNETQSGVRVMTRHRAHGVMLILGPFNFPGHLPNGHIVPAILAGNTVILKPSEQTPRVAELLVKFWEAAGLPKGVINLVQGDVQTAQTLLIHPQVQGILFTGSYKAGRSIHETLAGHPEKILALEMGGNNPLIVDEIDDIKAAVLTIIQSAFVNAGQRCTCARRLIVVKHPNQEALMGALMGAMLQLTVGLPMAQPQPFMGSVISKAAGEAILASQAALIKKGARPLIEVRKIDGNAALLSPGLIDVTMIERDDIEIFGPLLQVIYVDTLDEAIEEGNRTQYGLSASILTDNKDAFERFYDRARAGLVNWNKPTTGASYAAPFGGIGHSGNFRPTAYYAADYCAYPVVSTMSSTLTLTGKLPHGVVL